MKKTLSFLALLILLLPACARQLVLSKQGKSDYRIVVAEKADSLTRLGAARLASYFERVTGAALPVTTDRARSTAHEILVGPTNRLSFADSLGADGFVIRTDRGKLSIVGATGRGTLNGVYTFLDNYLGCRKYSAQVEVVPHRPDFALADGINDRQVPVLRFRDTHYRGTNDAEYVNWHKLSHDSAGGKPDWGLWVHTFERLVPPEKYYATHPEYYALVRGKRSTTQLCLSNPEVFEVLCANLERLIKQKPGATYWSVSTNDNFAYCTCDGCKALDEPDGGPTGSVIRFVNRVAERFPDKIISTLAYQYTRKAPLVTKPRANVNIMFCNIECNRSRPIASDPSSASFRKDMIDWAALTDNILVWDYVIQFKNLVSPFPNFHTLQPNLQFFVDHHVVAIFEQGNREVGGEFADLRAYLISKLLWNPQADVDSLMTDFTDGYYGAAGSYIRQYIGQMTRNLQQSGADLQIFGSPTGAVESYLTPAQMADYQALFDRAEAAVQDDSTLLYRVRVARQPLRYAQLEQTKLDPYGPEGLYLRHGDHWDTNPAYLQRLEAFVALCKQEGVTRLSEWHTTPDEYLEMMQKAAAIRQDGNVSFGKPVTLSPAPNRRYAYGGGATLTNGVSGTNDYTIQWLGWNTPAFEAVVDLGGEQPIRSISANYLQVLGDWIFLPRCVRFFVSSDGTHWTPAGECRQPEVDRKLAVGTKEFRTAADLRGRYVKVATEGVGTCPPWHLGAGGPAFAFTDEIIVE